MSQRLSPDGGRIRRFKPAALCLLLCAAALAATPPARAAENAPVDITLPALSLQDALLRLGQAARVTIISAPPLTAGKQAPAMRLRGSVADALRQ